MRRSIVSCFLATVAIVSSTSLPANAQDDAKMACQAMDATFEAALESGDPAKVVALYTADGEMNAPQGIFQGTEAIGAFAKTFMKPGLKDNGVLKSTRQVGNVLVCSGDYTLTFPPGSPVKEVTGHYTRVLTKSGNDWRLAQLTYNYTPSPAAH